MALLASIGTKLLSDFMKYVGLLGIEKFTSSNFNAYEKELLSIVEKTIEDYKSKYITSVPLRTQFYDSEILLTEIIKFRFTKSYNTKDLEEGIKKDKRIEVPSSSDISKFLELFSNNIAESQELKELNIENNYREEIFKISDDLKGFEDRVTNLIVNAKNDLIEVFKSDSDLVEDWSKQLDEIETNIQQFKPKTALERLEKLYKRICDKGVSKNHLEAKLLFLKALCLVEINHNDAGDYFIKAHKLSPNANEFKPNAAVNYVNKGDINNAERLIKELFERDDYDGGAWFAKCLINVKQIDSFVATIPPPVLAKKGFSAQLANWLIMIKGVEALDFIDKLGIGFDYKNEQVPESFTHKNKDIYVLVINYLMNKLFSKYPLLGINGDWPGMTKDKLFEVSRDILGKISNTMTGTEIEENYSWHKFHYMHMTYLLNKDIKSINEIEEVFRKIQGKTQAEYLFMMQIFNSLKDKESIKKSIALINEYGEEKDEALCFFNAYNYFNIGDIESSIKSFNNYLTCHSQIGHVAFVNAMQYYGTIHGSKFHEYTEKLKEIILAKTFGSDFIKDLFLILVSPVNEQEKDQVAKKIKSISENTPSNTERIAYYVGQAMLLYGLYDEAYSYFKETIITTHPSDELKIFCIASFHGTSDKHQLLRILEGLRNINYRDSGLISMELNLRLNLRDWEKVAVIAKYGVSLYPNNENFLFNLFSALDQMSKAEEIAREVSLVENHVFKNEKVLISLASILSRAKLFKPALELLYKAASDKKNKIVRQEFFTLRIEFPEELFKDYDTVILDSYVKYSYKDKSTVIHLTEETSKTPVGSVILGKKVNETFMFHLPLDDFMVSGHIDQVMNKYNALLHEIMSEMDNPLEGYNLKVIKLDEGEPNIEQLNKKFIEAFGARGSIDNEKREASLQEYYNGNISFTEITCSVFGRVGFDSYLYLTSSLGKVFRSISSVLNKKVLIDENTEFILDITSISLFYDLQIKHGLVFKNKFIVSSLLKAEVDELITKTEKTPEEQLSVNITLQGVSAFNSGGQLRKNRLDYFKGLSMWITENCKVDIVEDKLNIIATMDESMRTDDYFNYVVDCVVLSQRSNHILLTNDIFYYRHFQASTDQIVSPEIYLRKYFAERIPEFESYFLEKNYVGFLMSKETLQNEFTNMIAGKPNKFPICLENLGFSWNPAVEHLHVVSHFVKWLYLNNFVLPEVKRNTAISVFMGILKGMHPRVASNLKSLLDANFKLMGLIYSEVIQLYLQILKIVYPKQF
ncbi:MAG: hypothetical protein K0S32_2849 [Bacteroidetes bacterium]|jgi:tetratricopeptide (TPR) repeat protein|nr:hypothetical protein [Bacteroidota bacterium]